jgi:PadR family transcriptional regulator, regulatory protein AphA
MTPGKSRDSTTPFALLGLLSLGPGSGYDLKQRAQSSIGHFWSESYGQIYPALKRLQAKGLVTRAAKEAPRKPSRFVYAITKTGSEVLTQWLADPARREPFRSALLLKVFFGNHIAPEISTDHIRRVADEERRRLAQYEAVERDIVTRYPTAPGLPYWLTTLSYGRHRSQAILNWANETVHRLGAPAASRVRRKKK